MTCTACGALVETGWSFCRRCGQPVSAGAAVGVVAAHPNGHSAPGLEPDALGADPAATAGSPSRGPLGEPTPVTGTAAVAPAVGNWEGLPAGTGTANGTAASAVDERATLGDLLGVGQVVHTVTPAAVATASGRRRWPLWVLSAVLVVAVVAGSVTGWQLHARSTQLHDTRATLASTQHTLDTRTGELAAAKAQIADQAGQISELTGKNATLTSQLKDIQTQLTGTKNTIGRQTKEIGYLNTCLRGVSTALEYVAYGDYTDAIAQLDAVQTVCRKAQAGL